MKGTLLMNLNTTPWANRIHISIFGKRNAGKSNVINAITNQDLAIVSEQKGTTTDPVQKAMELLPIGPVVIIDTPGLDDQGTLGTKRVDKAYQVLNKTDIAILVVDGTSGITKHDLDIMEKIKEKNIPFVVAINKSDLLNIDIINDNIMRPDDINTGGAYLADVHELTRDNDNAKSTIYISAKTNHNINELKELIAKKAKTLSNEKVLVTDLINPGDFVVLVTPIDESAPKGRLILPQQQVIREIIEYGGAAIVVKETELAVTLTGLSKTPALIVTDSQVFKEVADIVPEKIPLTSFSILFARYKGNLKQLVDGTRALDNLNDNDLILVSEGCTHHRQCNDIGTVLLPNLITTYVRSKNLYTDSKKKLQFHFTSGTEFPKDVSKYKLIVHCGGCMLNQKEMGHRMLVAKENNIPMTNYGTAIAHIKGILDRSLTHLPH